MGKHHQLKALLLLGVILFHSFVLVPVAHATTWEGVAGRLAYRAFAPSVVAALGTGTALVVGAVVAGGVGYLVYKSGAVSALKTWWTANPGALPDASDYPMRVPYYYGSNGKSVRVWAGCSPGPAATFYLANGQYSYQGCYSNNPTGLALEINNWLAVSAPSPPTVPTDYSEQLAIAQPSFPSNSVYATPGAAAAVAGGAAIVSAVSMSDSDADRFIAGSGSSAVASGGSQAGNPNAPTANDNTITSGDSAMVALLASIAANTSSLASIRDSSTGVKSSVDNVVVGISQQIAVLDNVRTGITALRSTMDNVGVAIQNQTAILDNVGDMIGHMDNTLSGISTTTATVSTLQTRIDALRDAAATKFPFALVASIAASVPSGTAQYDFGSLPLTPTISIPIEPMAGPLATLFDWIRQLLVWFFWAGTLLAMLRKSMEM